MNRHVPSGPDGGPDWLGMAIELALDNVATGGWPFGAVIVGDGVLLATAVNEVAARNDPTAHAEIRAIQEACAVLDAPSLDGAVLYSSCEPCAMCMAAAAWAGLTAVVYGAGSDAAARAGFDDEKIYDLFDRPRDTWTMSVRRQEHHLAQSPMDAWKRSRQGGG